MSLGVNSFSSLSMPGSHVSVSASDSRESMRGLNTRLADYLAQVRALQEANSKLEAQIRDRVSSRSSEERDWTQYDKTIALLREQLKELTMDNARLMLQIDNARLAADDFKVKFEAEHGVRQGVDQDVANLRKMIDDTHMSRMQLESEIESLKEELLFLNRNHDEDVANLKGQIRDSSVDVQMEAKKGDNLSETIDKIRQQYEKAAQKSREETEAWYQAKFDNIAAEVSKSTETLQQGKSEVNDLRRQKQVLEIDLQALRTMNHSLEDNLKDTAGRSAQEMNHHNSIIQQLEAELGEIHAQVARQGAEYQALLNIKIKLEEEIGAYHRLLEGTGVDDGIRDTGDRKSGDVRGTGAREDTNVRGSGTRDNVNISIRGPGIRDDAKVKGTGTQEDIKVKGTGTQEDIKVKGTGTRDDATVKGTGTRDDDKVKSTGTQEDVKVKDSGAPEDANGNVGNTGVAEDDIVEFSLEQALNAAHPAPTPDQILVTSEEVKEEEVVSHSELKLNAANGTVEEEEEEPRRDGGEEEAVVLEEPPPSKSAAEDMVGKEEEEKQAAEEPEVLEKPRVAEHNVEENQAEEEPEVLEKPRVAEHNVEENQAKEEPEVLEKPREAEHKVEEEQEEAGQEVEVKLGEVGPEEVVLQELEVKTSLNEEEQTE